MEREAKSDSFRSGFEIVHIFRQIHWFVHQSV